MSDNVINGEYSFGVSASETLALTLAIVDKPKGCFESALSSATMFAKSADLVSLLVEALIGAVDKQFSNSQHWLKHLYPAFKG